MIIGYTTGVFDLFHIGHLNILKHAKGACDKLVVGVSTDELVKRYKNKVPHIPYEDRAEIVRNLRCVDVVVPQDSMDKFEAWKRLKFNLIFVGDDWYGKETWNEYERQFESVGVRIIYFPRTPGISTTERKARITPA
jgi:glycerol-3-phosphate cytidylyltransferase